MSLVNFSRIKSALINPSLLVEFVRLTSKGLYYRGIFKILGKRVSIGKNFKVRKKLSIKGPGRVIIGDNVYIDGTSHPVTPWTYSPEAEIKIGNNVFLNGTRFGCIKRITIGNDCIIADCRIIDTDFHSVNPKKRNDPDFIRSGPISIGNNVWISLGCVILRDVIIGDNATISAQSVVNEDVTPNCVYGGNPAVMIKKVLDES